MPEGLIINIKPSMFTAYPNTKYSVRMDIGATSDLQTGEYSFIILVSRLANGEHLSMRIPEEGSFPYGFTVHVNRSN
jgi:hypothetical protein